MNNELRYPIEFGKQVLLSMGLEFTGLDSVQRKAIELLEGQGWLCTRTKVARVEDLPLLYHCMQRTAEQLGIQCSPRIVVFRPPVGGLPYTFYRYVSEFWPPLDASGPVLIPYNVRNLEVLLAIVNQLPSLQLVVSRETSEDISWTFVPNSHLTDFASDLDAVVFMESAALRWQNLEVFGPVSKIHQVLKVLDKMTQSELPTGQFVEVSLFDSDRRREPLVRTHSLKGDSEKLVRYARRLKVIFHDFPDVVAQRITHYVDIWVAVLMHRRHRRDATVKVRIGNGRLRVEPPDTIWFPSNRLYGRTSLPTQALTTVYIVKMLESLCQVVKR
jgi:hypothetical protein